jgi:hypothetical protein
MVNTQTGGAGLIHPEKTGFTPIYDMLTSPGARLELFTYSSLHGFMFELIVEGKDTEYSTFSANGAREMPITNFILKIVATTTVTKDLPSHYFGVVPEYFCDFNGVEKQSVTSSRFFDEAKMQQEIWLKSISGGDPEICPAIANVSFFINENSQQLIDLLLSKNTTRSGEAALNRLNECVNGVGRGRGLGIILMPKIMNSFTVDSLRSFDRIAAYSNILAQVVRLFMNIGIIHTDLHEGNVLLYPSKTGINSSIIDFGRVIKANDDRWIAQQITDLRRKFNHIITLNVRHTTITPTEKTRFIREVVDLILSLNSKMRWLIQFAQETQSVYSNAFDIYQGYFNSDEVIAATSEPHFLNFEGKHPSDFNVDFSQLSARDTPRIAEFSEKMDTDRTPHTVEHTSTSRGKTAIKKTAIRKTTIRKTTTTRGKSTRGGAPNKKTRKRRRRHRQRNHIVTRNRGKKC